MVTSEALLPVDRNLLKQGRVIYEQICIACHGADGKGVQHPGLLRPLPPTLVGSAFVLGPKEALVRVLLHGMTGPLDGKTYEAGLMAPLGAATPNAWTAAVLSFIRHEWNNEASIVRPEVVTAIRAKAKDHGELRASHRPPRPHHPDRQQNRHLARQRTPHPRLGGEAMMAGG